MVRNFGLLPGERREAGRVRCRATFEWCKSIRKTPRLGELKRSCGTQASPCRPVLDTGNAPRLRAIAKSAGRLDVYSFAIAAFERHGRAIKIKATLNKYRRRHDAWKARRVCCVAPGRLAVLPSRAAQPAGLPGITPSFSIQSVGASPVCPHAFGPSSRQTASLPSPTALWPANRQGW